MEFPLVVGPVLRAPRPAASSAACARAALAVLVDPAQGRRRRSLSTRPCSRSRPASPVVRVAPDRRLRGRDSPRLAWLATARHRADHQPARLGVGRQCRSRSRRGSARRRSARWSACGQVGDLANACFALVAVYILAVDWRAGWLMVVVVAVLLVRLPVLRARRARAPRASSTGQPVHRRSSGASSTLDAVVRTVLREVREAFDVVSCPPASSLTTDGAASTTGCLDGRRARGPAVRRWPTRGRTAGDRPVLRASRDRPTGLGARTADRRARLPSRYRSGSRARPSAACVVADMLGDVETFTARRRPTSSQALGNHAAVVDRATPSGARPIARQAASASSCAMHDELTGLRQPAAVRAPAGRGAGQTGPAAVAAAGPRPVQGRQRHPRAPDRRPPARHGRRAAARSVVPAEPLVAQARRGRVRRPAAGRRRRDIALSMAAMVRDSPDAARSTSTASRSPSTPASASP